MNVDLSSPSLSPSSSSDLLEELGGVPSRNASTNTLAETNDLSNHYSPGVSSSIEERALSLLGAGVDQESVASAVGVTPSRISQLLAGKDFADKVSKLRYDSLTQHNLRDSKYDSLEDRLLTKLNGSLGLLVKPLDIVKVMTVVNSAKRRGHTSTHQITNTQNIVTLVMPTKIVQKFSVNINNQVITAGDQDLLTMTSSNLLKRVEDQVKEITQVIEVQDVQVSGRET